MKNIFLLFISLLFMGCDNASEIQNIEVVDYYSRLYSPSIELSNSFLYYEFVFELNNKSDNLSIEGEVIFKILFHENNSISITSFPIKFNNVGLATFIHQSGRGFRYGESFEIIEVKIN